MSETNITAVRGLYAAFARGDIAAIVNGCTQDVEWISGGQKGHFPVFGSRRGRAGVESFFKDVADTQEFTEFSPREFYADKDKVFVLGHYALTVKRTGRKAAAEWIHVFTFHGGKVIKFQEFTDTATFADAYCGPIPQPASP